jgi:hypothetical protein
MVCESKIMYGTDVRRLSEAWKELDKIHSIFCSKLMSILNYAANGLAEMEFGRERKINKCTGQMVKSWYQSMCLDIDDLAKQCYKWQK